ncbi:MAG: DivIVA domain-containing protein [Dermatophilaceae bacterium]
MIVFFLLIVVLLIGLTAGAVMGKIGGFMADPTSSQPSPGWSEVAVDSGRPLSGGDIRQLQFAQALRGYRMGQVDEVIDALGARLLELEAEVARLRAPTGQQSAPGEPRGR